MLGHSDVGITLKIYHHVNAKSIMQMHQEYSPLSDLRITEGVRQVRPHSALGYRPPAPETILTTITT